MTTEDNYVQYQKRSVEGGYVQPELQCFTEENVDQDHDWVQNKQVESNGTCTSLRIENRFQDGITNLIVGEFRKRFGCLTSITRAGLISEIGLDTSQFFQAIRA